MSENGTVMTWPAMMRDCLLGLDLSGDERGSGNMKRDPVAT